MASAAWIPRTVGFAKSGDPLPRTNDLLGATNWETTLDRFAQNPAGVVCLAGICHGCWVRAAPIGVARCTTQFAVRSDVRSPAARRTAACSLAEEFEIPTTRANDVVVCGASMQARNTQARVRPSRSPTGQPAQRPRPAGQGTPPRREPAAAAPRRMGHRDHPSRLCRPRSERSG